MNESLVHDGDTVLVGLSGGADSVCLLLMLLKLRSKLDFSLSALHVNHGLRAEAASDALWCVSLCERLGVACEVVCPDVAGEAMRLRISTEDAARRLRYAAYEAQLRLLAPDAVANGTASVAVAHHADDQAETVLMRLARGTGPTGLCGIAPARKHDNITVIRPLLALTRVEIEAYLRSVNQEWLTDSTNDTDYYTRNKIRHNVLPPLKEIYPGAVAGIARAAGQMAEEESYIDSVVWEIYAGMVRVHPISLPVSSLRALHPFICKRVIMTAIKEAGAGTDITARHIDAVLGILAGPGMKRTELPGGINVMQAKGELIFYAR